MKRLAFSIFFAASAAIAAERQPFERYQSIVDRQMFGELPKGFDPEKMPSEVSKSSSRKELTKEQEKLQRAIHFSVINVAADGTPVVGFTDNGDPKTPVHHYVKVGEESGGWKVISADPAESSMTVEKDGVELTLKLGDKSGSGGNARSSSAEHTPAVLPASASAQDGEVRTRSTLLGSLRSRRAQRARRQEEERKKQEEERARLDQDREEMRQQLQATRDEQVRLREEKEAAAAKAAAAESKEPANENDNAQ